MSELATNALLHGVPPGRGFRLRLRRGCDGLLRIEVHDSGPGDVRVPARTPESAGGRGLVLVATLAAKWGVEEHNPGKAVWCEISL